MLDFCVCFCDFGGNSAETNSWYQAKESPKDMTYISIQSGKCVFLKVLEVLILQISVKGQIPGNHCYNQLFHLGIVFYNKSKSQRQYLHMVFTSISWHFLSDCSLASLSKCKLFLGWKLMCPTATSFEKIQVWSYKMKFANGRPYESPAYFLFVPEGVLSLRENCAQYKWCISWVLAME